MHIVNTMSKFRGNHSLKMGGEARLSRNAELFNQSISGTLGFAVQGTAQPGVANTGNAIASMLAGMANSGSIQSTQFIDRRAWYYALFVHDDWNGKQPAT